MSKISIKAVFVRQHSIRNIEDNEQIVVFKMCINQKFLIRKQIAAPYSPDSANAFCRVIVGELLLIMYIGSKAKPETSKKYSSIFFISPTYAHHLRQIIPHQIAIERLWQLHSEPRNDQLALSQPEYGDGAPN